MTTRTSKIAIFPGTFDPPTYGHLDIAKRAAQLFDHIYIAIGQSLSKPISNFTPSERLKLFQRITKEIHNIEIVTFSGLLVDLASQLDVQVIVRGIRNSFDFEYETSQAEMNRKLSGIETLFLPVDENYRHISSSLVREVAIGGKRLHPFIPIEIEEEVFQKLSQINEI